MAKFLPSASLALYSLVALIIILVFMDPFNLQSNGFTQQGNCSANNILYTNIETSCTNDIIDIIVNTTFKIDNSTYILVNLTGSFSKLTAEVIFPLYEGTFNIGNPPIPVLPLSSYRYVQCFRNPNTGDIAYLVNPTSISLFVGDQPEHLFLILVIIFSVVLLLSILVSIYLNPWKKCLDVEDCCSCCFVVVDDSPSPNLVTLTPNPPNYSKVNTNA